MEHRLKCDPIPFDLVSSGRKTFELRQNDRDYSVGDILELAQTRYTGGQMRDGKPLEYTGAVITVGVSHVLHGPLYGLLDGWVILSLRPSVPNA